MLKMNCLELRYNKNGESKLIKITRGSENEQVTNQSDNISDWDLLFDFLTTGNLPKDVRVEGLNNKEDLLDFLVSELSKSPTKLQTYMLFDRTGGISSRSDVINKVIGNKSIQSVLYDTYLNDMFTNNCLYVSGWGAKTWYGFTENRPLMITGRTSLDQNPTENTLFTSYYELRNGSKFVADIINKLFEKHADYQSDDIYDKLTWLANNKLKVLVDALYIPQYKSIDKETIRRDLISNITPYIGCCVKYKSELYVITKKGNNNTIIGTNIDTNEKIEIPISSIFNIYEPFLITSKKNTYYLFNKTWYIKQNKKYIKIDDKEKTSKLFDYFFGIIDGDYESLNVYSTKNPVTLSTVLPKSTLTLAEALPIGSRVRISSGSYTKQITGEFKNGDEILDESAIIYKIDYKIDQNNQYNNIDLIKSLFPISEPAYALSQQDALIILSDIYEFDVNDESLWDKIKFSYDNDGVRVRQIGEDVILDIGLKGKVLQTLKNIKNLNLAVTYFNYLCNGELDLDGMSVLDFWYVLESFKEGNTEVKIRNKKITLTQKQIASAMEIINNTVNPSDENLTEWEDSVKRNREEVLKVIHNENDDEWDTFINELINKGLYIMSCKL